MTMRRLGALSAHMHWYGGTPLHLLALTGCFAIAGYAALRLFDDQTVGVAVWLVAAVVGHDLVLLPLYAVADHSAQAALRRRALPHTGLAWVNYLRVPVVLSGLALLVYFPSIFGLSSIYPEVTAMSNAVYLQRWLLLTGTAFTVSALMFALKLRAARRSAVSSNR